MAAVASRAAQRAVPPAIRRVARLVLPLLAAAGGWFRPAAAQAQAPPGPADLAARLRAAVPALAGTLAAAREHRLQIVIGEPIHHADGTVSLRRTTLGDLEQYFYPASSVKVCAAVAALLELTADNARLGTAFGLHTAYAVLPRFDGDVRRPPRGLDADQTLATALQKLFVVSDNQAYNDLYELVGHRRLNEILAVAGFPSIRIRHRLSEFRSVAEQRQTRAVALYDGEASPRVLPERDSDLVDDNLGMPGLLVGAAHMSGGVRVDEPLDFRHKNVAPLVDLQDLLAALVRPELRTGRRGFPDLTTEHRAFVVRALGTLPRESTAPAFSPDLPDHYTRFLLPGVRRVVLGEHLRVYTKIGRAYGFSTENAYVEDLRTGRGVFVAATLYTNRDGVLNDDAYEYETVADPFFADLGEAVARIFLLPAR